MLQRDRNYLYSPYHKAGGLDSKIQDLELLINAALSTRRIPIINEEITDPNHRLDNINIPEPIIWDRYINLSATKIFKVEPGQVIKKVPDTLRYIYQRNFDFNSYTKDQIRYIDKTQLYDKENEQYPIICLLKANDIAEIKETPKSIDQHNYTKRIDTNYDYSFVIVFQPSQEVNDLTDIVLSHFGTTRENMNTWSSIAYSLHRQGIGFKFYSKEAGHYACMHVRYEARRKKHAQRLSKSDLMINIEETIKMVYRRHKKKPPLYIMSDIMETNYFDFLKPRYDIYRYTNFKELRAQFIERERIDHNLLYSVEKNIMKHAIIKIFPHKRNKLIFELPQTNK